MHLEPNAIYHIYNRSNEKIFFNRDNYLFFLKRIKQHIHPICDIIAWVLMPNHFHILIQATEISCQNTGEKHRSQLQHFSKNLGSVLNSHTQAINKQQNRRGRLFSHESKAKNLHEQTISNANHNSKHYSQSHIDYATTCFLYIHQNPVMAGLVTNLHDWEFSSFRDYAGLRNGSLINIELAKEIIELDFNNFQQQSQFLVDEEKLKKIF